MRKMNFKAVLASFVATHKSKEASSDCVIKPLLSEYEDIKSNEMSTFETKLDTYYKATYVMYQKLHHDIKSAIAQKYKDYIDIQQLRKDIIASGNGKKQFEA